ncbi:hypothetical protein KIW84_056212 [Lathyrus oleraceus]|uniref:Aminotransferase-like plant mobile domain-containing protein n=1 Tax=Pisum sativum TaxID=3888 RepID=A0A9D4X058_PEA|nr:hypothetical protein KIW84_056212 [Pisum sativum]
MIVSCLIIPSGDGQNFKTTYVQFIEKFDEVDSYAWGAAILSHLYQGLKENNLRNKKVDGFVWLIMRFFIYHFKGLYEILNINAINAEEDHMPNTPLLAYLIKDIFKLGQNRHTKPHHQLGQKFQLIRNFLDMDHEDIENFPITWHPYTEQMLPPDLHDHIQYRTIGNKGNNPINFKAHFKKELRQWEDIDRRYAQNFQTIEASTSETADDIEASTSETASDHQSPNIENSTSGASTSETAGDIEASTSETASGHQSPNIENSTSGDYRTIVARLFCYNYVEPQYPNVVAKQFEELDDINLTGVGSDMGVIISKGNKGNNPINFKAHFKKELRQWKDIDRRFAQNFSIIEASTSETAGDIEASTSETASDHQSPNIENNTSGAKKFEELDDINLTGVGSHLGVIISKGNKGNSPINFKAHFKKELRQWEDIDRRFSQNFQTIEASTSETAGDIEASTSETASDHQSPNIENNTSGDVCEMLAVDFEAYEIPVT